MLRLSARHWRGGVALGLGLPLLLGSGPAAAGGLGYGVVGLPTWLGLVAALWALFGARMLPSSASGIVFALLALAMLGSAWWAWRRQQGSAISSANPVAARAAPVVIPDGLDGAAVLDAARARFLRLQAAWDVADISTLKSLTTPEMLEELMHVLTARGAGTSRTDVITLHAELLALEELSAAYLASVEFSGMIRESAERGPVPFRELWMLACMKDDGASWRLARQQSLF
ncbi:MAG TPA: Tim44-like domain-containing protein [Caldimonas sp.]|nr:Tim44-like domain-containing protein [Caldimonas sp.]